MLRRRRFSARTAGPADCKTHIGYDATMTTSVTLTDTLTDKGRPPLRRISSLPGPRPWPQVGNLFQIRPLTVHRDIERWCLRYGTFFPVYFGRTQVLVVADHEAVAAILRDRPDGFRRPSVTARISDEMGGLPGLFLSLIHI